MSFAEWFIHFKNVLGGDTNPGKGKDDYADPPDTEGLDSPISEEEVTNAIELLKLNKSPGPDGILAERLKNSLEHIPSLLVLLFNHVFDTVQYPNAWSGSLLSILRKSFAYIINKRLTLWVDEDDKIV